MHAKDITEEWLRSLSFTRVSGGTATIDGVLYRPLTVHLDGRGDVTELWSAPWPGVSKPAHVYQSATDFGVVKCWHVHEEHTDQFTVTRVRYRYHSPTSEKIVQRSDKKRLYSWIAQTRPYHDTSWAHYMAGNVCRSRRS